MACSLVWSRLLWQGRQRRQAINLHRLVALPGFASSGGASGLNRFRTFCGSFCQRSKETHATPRHATLRHHSSALLGEPKQKPLAMSQALFIVNEMDETDHGASRSLCISQRPPQRCQMCQGIARQERGRSRGEGQLLWAHSHISVAINQTLNTLCGFTSMLNATCCCGL